MPLKLTYLLYGIVMKKGEKGRGQESPSTDSFPKHLQQFRSEEDDSKSQEVPQLL